jgi:ubiquinone/menaquinone biosynthesis C-methylase UbiE
LGSAFGIKGDSRMANTEPFDKFPEKYDLWFQLNYYAYQSELHAVKDLLPENGVGMEVGIGSGRFAKPLGIKHGVEPSAEMRMLARSRGIDVIDGVAESLPFNDKQFDFVLMITTLCFLDDVGVAFKEVYRVLKRNGFFIIGFVDKDSSLGKLYQFYKNENPFYKAAQFYSVYGAISYLKDNGFGNMHYVQTIFHNLSEIREIEPVKAGFGEGSFVVVKAEKNA